MDQTFEEILPNPFSIFADLWPINSAIFILFATIWLYWPYHFQKLVYLCVDFASELVYDEIKLWSSFPFIREIL